MQNYISSKIGNFFNSNTQSMDSREQLRIIISRFTSFTTRNLFKKKEREGPSIKIPWTFFDSTYTTTHTLGSIQLGWKGSEKSIWRRRKRFRNGAEVFIGYRFCRGSATSTPRLACVAFWNTRLDKTASARSRQKAEQGIVVDCESVSTRQIGRKNERESTRNSARWPGMRNQNSVSNPPSISLSPPLLPLLSPLLLLLSRDQQSRRVFLRASKAGCTCYRFNYVRTCGPCAPCVLRSSPTLLSIANETRRNVVRSCKSLEGKARR